MKILTKTTLQELQGMSHNFFDEMVKGVVDIENEILAVDADLHSDLEAILLKQGSKQENLWGNKSISFYKR